jgi:hypothetical protein
MFCFLLLVTGPERKRERNKGLVKLKFIKGLREEHIQFNNISTISIEYHHRHEEKKE